MLQICRLHLILTLPLLAAAQTYKIDTVAGGGPIAGTPGTGVYLNSGEGVAVDSLGNRYFAVASLNQVYKFDSSGNFVSAIGTGFPGFGGDGGQAANAWLASPEGMAFDLGGNLLIADSANHCIRKVDASTGVISTVAGGAGGSFTGDGGNAVGAGLNYPKAVAVDSAGNIYIADYSNNRVRKVNASTQIITTVAGSNSTGGFGGDNASATAATARLNGPRGLMIDPAGNIYIADNINNRIRKVDISTGIISTIAGTSTGAFSGDGGLATVATLRSPVGLARDAAGNIYVGDNGNAVVRKINASDRKISTVAGTGGQSGFSGDGASAKNAKLRTPTAIAIDASGDLWIADSGNSRLRKVSGGIISTIAGSGQFAGDTGAAISSRLSSPRGLAIDANGNAYVADFVGTRVRRIDAVTGAITTIAGGGTGTADNVAATATTFSQIASMAIDTAGNLFIADPGRHKIRKVNTSTGIITAYAGTGTGGFTGDNGPATSAQINAPRGLALDASGNLYFTNVNRIRKVDPLGVITTIAGTGSAGATGDGGPAVTALLSAPESLSTDSAGNVYIADTGNYRIRRINVASGVITTVAGGAPTGLGEGGPATAARLVTPSAVHVDAAGNIFIGDRSDQRIRKVSVADSKINTVVGNGSGGFGGDGGNPTSAMINGVSAIASDSYGGFWISDTNNNRLRRISLQAPVTITSVPAGRTVTVDGVPVVTPANVTWNGGSVHSLSASDAPINAGERYRFASWSHGGNASQNITVPAVGATYNANFTQQFTLTTFAGSGGTILPATGWFDADSSQPVTATPNSGFSFQSFSGDLTGAINPQNISMTAARSVSASFVGAAATIQLDSLTQVYNGLPKVVTATTVPANLTVDFTYNGSLQAPTAAGNYAVEATINDPIYAGSASGTLVISKAAPILTWNQPAPIVFGSALGSAQLNAGANVPGSMTYLPGTGTVLSAGNHPLSVTFAPVDTNNYTAATASTNLQVNAPANPGVQLVITRSLSRDLSSYIVVHLTIANTGGISANNVALSSLKIGTVAGTPVPQPVGTIAPGESVQLAVLVPGSVGAPGAASSLSLTATHSGGTVSSTSRITLP